MSTRPDEDLLDDIFRAAERIERRLSGVTFDKFLDDDVLQDAVILQIAVIGEAARGLSDELKGSHPEIPWPDITNMRNRLVHAYHLISMSIVWDTATGDVPELVRRLRASEVTDEGSED
ncbi:MAG: DUF86 domain-containing protein [Chloroflexi bacterium]|nr:DUF86 domain-containing protein [Chloroflexota bacterium]